MVESKMIGTSVEQHLDLPVEPSPPAEIPLCAHLLVIKAASFANGHASWGGHPVILVYCDGRGVHDAVEVACWEFGPHGALGWSGGPAGASPEAPAGRPRIDNAPEGGEHIANRAHIATATVTLRAGKSALYGVSCNHCTLQMPPIAHEKLTEVIREALPHLPRHRDISVISLYGLSTVVGRLE